MAFTTFPKTHIGLQTRDLEAAITFYTHLLGMPPAKVQPGYAKFLLDAPPLNLALTAHPTATAHPGHFGLQVATTEDVVARHTALAVHYPVQIEQDVRCCYARQDKVWVTDPDGNRWEIFVFHEDVDVNDPPYQRTLPQAVAASEPSCCIETR